ncbi:MAG: nitroreductase family protein [Candidatus Micrarchaeota archaeon]|nr:nitroreductase family protein [Candidatus Micrarchaeota archaeon]
MNPFKAIRSFGARTSTGNGEYQDVEKTVKEIILSRRSVRKYTKQEVSEKDILDLIDAARFAPSAGNRQPWEFIIVTDEKTRKALTEACFNQEWMMQAPVFIVACINMKIASATYGERGVRLYCIQSVAAAIQNMLLLAEAKGLGTCWVGAFSEQKVSLILECPEYIRPCAIITVGHPAEVPETPFRNSVKDITHFEKFGKRKTPQVWSEE